jgi:uncharacterized protein (TIGR02145 family)
MKYKLIYLIISGVIIIGCSFNESSVPLTLKSNEKGSFTDTRDGKIYKTIKIGDQWIMAENLAYQPANGNYWAYDNDTMNVAKYGYLYDWETAKQVAPPGWHLPTQSDFLTLRKLLGGKRDLYKYLRGTMEVVYKQMVVGGCGFNALMAGVRRGDGKFFGLGGQTDFWSSTKTTDGQCFYTLDAKIDGKPRGLLDSKDGTAALADQQDNATWGKSVRLFKD